MIQGLRRYSYRKEILSETYLHLLSHTSESNESSESTRCGLNNVLTIATRMALGERRFVIDYESDPYQKEVGMMDG